MAAEGTPGQSNDDKVLKDSQKQMNNGHANMQVMSKPMDTFHSSA